MKFFNKKVDLTFKSKYKNIMFPKQSDECEKHITGNIYLNIIPKDLRGYKIINNYDLLYIKYIDFETDLKNSKKYSFELLHFDNREHKIIVDNLILNKEYVIENMGLYSHNSNKRNNLIIIFMNKPSTEKTTIFFN